MNVASYFSGVGGLDLGLERAGLRVVSQCEADPWRRRVLAWHWPDVPCSDDVRDVRGAVREERARSAVGDRGTVEGAERSDGEGRLGSAGGVDLVCGGVPCQDWSVAGKRAGIQGARSGLFFDWCDRIADFPVRPRWLLFENVPGLLAAANGRDFAVVLRTLVVLGYGLAWRVLDARYFGVPQRRRRVFIVGHSGGEPGPAVRALGAGGEGDLEAGECSWQGSPAGTGSGAEIAGSLTRRYGKGVNSTVDERALVVNAPLDRQAGGPDDNSAQADLIPVRSFAQNQRGELRESEIAPQLTAGGGKPGQGYPAMRAGSTVRRLTPVECERLMSWPDGWTAVDGDRTPDGKRYAACGDGVVSNVSEWIGRRIVAVDQEAEA